MIIAAPYDNMGNVPKSIRRAKTFKIYVAEDGGVVRSKLVFHFGVNKKTPLPELLSAQGAEVLVCRKASGGEVKAFEAAGIKVVPGYEGNGDRCVAEYLDKTK